MVKKDCVCERGSGEEKECVREKVAKRETVCERASGEDGDCVCESECVC